MPREYAAKALGKIDSEAKAVVLAWAKALKDEDDDVRQYAAGVLEKVNIKAEKTEDAEFVWRHCLIERLISVFIGIINGNR